MSSYLGAPIEVKPLRARDNRSARNCSATPSWFVLKTCDNCRQYIEEKFLAEQGLTPPEEALLRAIFGECTPKPHPNAGKFFCEPCVAALPVETPKPRRSRRPSRHVFI
jgi:hypothetical protein